MHAYIIKEKGLYQNKVSSSPISTRNCAMDTDYSETIVQAMFIYNLLWLSPQSHAKTMLACLANFC